MFKLPKQKTIFNTGNKLLSPKNIRFKSKDTGRVSFFKSLLHRGLIYISADPKKTDCNHLTASAEDDYHALINSCDNQLWSISCDFKLVAANESFIKSIEAFVSIRLKPGDDLLTDAVFPKEFLDFWRGCYVRALSGESFHAEVFIPAFNKLNASWIDTGFKPIYKDGKISGVACHSVDITERKKAEGKIKETEIRYQSLIEQATDAICIADQFMQIIDINPRGCQMLGYTKAEFLKLSIADLFIIEDLETNPFKLDELNTGNVISNERRFKRKDASIIEVEINARILEDRRFVVFARDITERKKAEKEVQEAYHEKNIILESIDDGFFAIDKNSLVTYWNRKAEELLGEKREDVIGRNLHEMFARPDSGVFYENYQKAIRENSTVHFEAFSHRTDKWFAVSAFASDNGLSVHFKEVTERKVFEEKVKESEIRYRSLIEQATDTICIFDTSSRFVEVNPSGCDMFGYSREEILCLHVNDVLFAEDLEANPILIEDLRVKKAIYNERRIKRKDGTAVEVELNSKMLDDGRVVVFGRDITERKLAAQKLEESNQRYNLISKATNDMVWDWDLVSGKIYRNKEGWKKIFRTGNKKIDIELISDWNDRVHPEDRDKVKQVSGEVNSTKKDFFEVECRVLRDDGTYAYIHDRGNIIRDKEGKAVRLIGATQDITQRKEAEMQLAKSELHFRSLVQNSSDLTGILDARGYYLYCSPAIKKILGYEPEFMLGKNAFGFVHPDDMITIKAHLSRKKDENYIGAIQFRFKNAAGAWRWLESKITDMSGDPEVNGYIFNSRDVTERKTAEAEIEKLSIIARETSNAVIITDTEGEIVWVNEAFTSITEYTFEDAIGRKPGDFLQGEDTNLAVVRFMRSKIKKVEPFECDILNYSKSGRKYWLRIQCQPQFDENGKLKYFFAIETDVTKEKQAEEILKNSEERYRYLFNNNPASIIIWDIETFEILEVNETTLDMYGYTRKEMLSKSILDLRHPQYHNKIKLFAEEARQKHDFLSVNTRRHLNKSGEEMYLNIASHRIQFKSREVILALATNITEKVFLEQELENERHIKQQEITAAVISAQEQERRELGSELHDNINQILAGARLYLGLAAKELNIDHPYLTETGTLINSAITEIRNLSHSLIPPSLHESELLEAINNIMEVTHNASGIVINLHAHGFEEKKISDKLKLGIYRIIQEQFNNILKHADAQKIIIRLVQDKKKTVLSIKDDGVGFDTGKKAKGVGLMNIKTRASLFNGEMMVISSPGNGCELKVIFN